MHTEPGAPAGQSAFSSPITRYLEGLRETLLKNTSGEVASYIPELAHADPMSFGIAVATMDGTVYECGATTTEFTIQSMSKPFTYGQALMTYGTEAVLKRVGVEPTGEAFNSIVLDEVHNRPFNPMVNAGAISIANILYDAQAETSVTDLFSRLAGRPLSIDNAVFQSELETGHRNRAISYMMLNTGMIDKDPERVLDLYFRQCSIRVNCRDMAYMAATLGNLGQHPLTRDEIFEPEHVQDVLTLMSTCGMYDYAGQWAYEVGIAAKSGVSGGVIAVIPGQAGIAVWSPPLDPHGNSVRGVEVCKAISREFGLHGFRERATAGTVIRHHRRASEAMSKRMRSESERAWLQRHGQRVSVTELQGALYFGSAETVIRRLAAETSEVEELVIDFRRVGYADAAASRLLVQSLREFLALGCRVTMSGLGDSTALARLAGEIAAQCDGVERYPDLDLAVQAAEDRLLGDHYDLVDRSVYSLSRLSIFSGLQPEDYRLLESIVSPVSYMGGQRIIAEGDPAEAFYILASGSASVSITLGDGRRRRLASLGPGATFGEMALVDGGERTADVHADNALVAYKFSLDKIRTLSVERPQIMATILANIVKDLAGRLRQANEEIRSLD
ncbi:glutaminase A [Ovoidimarina sediminis]|uniref:glutaminase A n=1 Tax=Ovoidimarina sediminis TaxID=3079856 RepID=UPI00292DB664|nr:glutaminase A [Rhodophyticola sp. MJ-SS7]